MPAKAHEPTDTVTTDSGDIKVNKKGVTLNWRVCGIIALVLVSGGGFSVAARSMLGLDSAAPAPATAIEKAFSDNNAAHVIIEGRLKGHDEAFVKIGEKLDSVQTVQRRQTARDEARRVTATIKDRVEREAAYDRLLDINLKHLAEGKDTCQTSDCGL